MSLLFSFKTVGSSGRKVLQDDAHTGPRQCDLRWHHLVPPASSAPADDVQVTWEDYARTAFDGLLARLRDLGFSILSVKAVEIEYQGQRATGSATRFPSSHRW